MEKGYYIGVDVGSGSARACLINDVGDMLSLKEVSVSRQELKPDHITQSSREIWNAVCECVRYVVVDSKIDPQMVKGIGFDATCSLVVIDEENDSAISVGPNFDDNQQNIIMWLDHRASVETDLINKTNAECLKYVGGQMSIEMELPKIKWLKGHMPVNKFARCKFFDLPDYLTYKATGKQARSFCSVVCKQGFLPMGVENSRSGWSREFLTKIGLEELIDDDYRKLGGSLNNQKAYLTAGETVGKLSPIACSDLGLPENCQVSSGIIDAYAGWIGTVAAQLPSLSNDKSNGYIDEAIGRLAAVAGTSTCHIMLAKNPIFVPGVWGPYRDVLVSNYWCTEGGQSCTGALLQHILKTHPAYNDLIKFSREADLSHYEFLNSILEYLMVKRNTGSILPLAKNIFLYGDFHGNRSPIGDPNMRATIIGQSMDTSIESLAVLYLAACEFITLQTRHIIEAMVKAGHEVNYIYMSGGQCRNSLLMKLLANATGLDIVIPKYIDSAVVFGSAILGACAWRNYYNKTKDEQNTLWEVMKRLTPHGEMVHPDSEESPDRRLLNVKYKIFHDMIDTQKRYRRMIKENDDAEL